MKALRRLLAVSTAEAAAEAGGASDKVARVRGLWQVIPSEAVSRWQDALSLSPSVLSRLFTLRHTQHVQDPSWRSFDRGARPGSTRTATRVLPAIPSQAAAAAKTGPGRDVWRPLCRLRLRVVPRGVAISSSGRGGQELQLGEFQRLFAVANRRSGQVCSVMRELPSTEAYSQGSRKPRSRATQREEATRSGFLRWRLLPLQVRLPGHGVRIPSLGLKEEGFRNRHSGDATVLAEDRGRISEVRDAVR